MNQILMTEAVNKNAKNKSRVSNSSDITAVVRFFAIIIMVFGVAVLLEWYKIFKKIKIKVFP